MDFPFFRAPPLPVRRAALAAAVLLAAGCTTIDTYAPTLRNFGVYKLDINQGNFLSQDMVDKLKVGQTSTQVKLILGTPLIVTLFRDDRWDYAYSSRARDTSPSSAISPSISSTTSSRAGRATKCRSQPPKSTAKRRRARRAK